MTVLVREVQETDLADVTRLHLAAFPHQFTTSLGPRVVRDYYARALDRTSTMRIIVAESDRRLVGLAATLQPESFYAQYRRRRMKVLALSLPALVTSPALARKVIGATIRARESASYPMEGLELSSIAVDAAMRGSGIGTTLIAAVREQSLATSGRIYLWTDLEDNEPTRAFYRGLGFIEREERCFDGSRRMIRLTLDVDPPDALKVTA